MLDTFRPLLEAAHGLDLAQPVLARAELQKRFDPAGPAARTLRASLLRLYEEGKIAQNGALPVRWGRAAKATPETLDQSIDVVVMNGPGPLHRHPRGEVNYCIALEGAPRFDGQEPGWVVFPPASRHVPTVSGGTMLIVYLLPQGQIEFIK
jgi:Domain of unknown function (DUF4863)